MIAIIGLIVGIASNLLYYFGNTLLNFTLSVVLISIHEGLQLIGFSGFSAPLIVFIQWYFVGTFGVKILSLIPIPFIQPISQIFAGD